MTTRNASVPTVTGDMYRRQRLVFLVLWGVMIVLWALIVTTILAFGAEPSSVWQGFRWAPQYALLFVGVAVAAMYTPVYVAHGIPRRTVVLAATGFGLLAAMASAVAMTLVVVAERGLYNVLGLTQFPDGLDLAASFGSVLLAAFDFTVMYLVYFVAGWLMATAYYRLGGWLGTAILIAALVPIVLAEAWPWRAPMLYDLAPVLGDQAWMGSVLLAGLGVLLWGACARLVGSVAVRIK